MATMNIQTVTSKRREFRVPCNGDRNSTDHAELVKALDAAAREFEQLRGKPASYADDILVRPTDDEIIVYFELGEEVGP